jgi:hypothetical protein
VTPRPRSITVNVRYRVRVGAKAGKPRDGRGVAAWIMQPRWRKAGGEGPEAQAQGRPFGSTTTEGKAPGGNEASSAKARPVGLKDLQDNVSGPCVRPRMRVCARM